LFAVSYSSWILQVQRPDCDIYWEGYRCWLSKDLALTSKQIGLWQNVIIFPLVARMCGGPSRLTNHVLLIVVEMHTTGRIMVVKPILLCGGVALNKLRQLFWPYVVTLARNCKHGPYRSPFFLRSSVIYCGA
jgi:hypothetical protein